MDVREALLCSPDSARHPWEKARFTVVERLIRRHAPQVFGSRSLVADIGCGDMYVVRKLAQMIPLAQFVAVDTELDRLNLSEADLPEELKRVALHTDVKQALRSVGTRVDLVLLLDVLEHIEDERRFLADILSHDCIGPETLFVVTVPAFAFLFSSHDTFLGHHRRYSVRALLSVVRDAGLRPHTHGYFFCSLFLARLALVALEKTLFARRTKHAQGIGGYTRKPVLDELVQFALVTDFTLTHALGPATKFIPGLSAYALCTKPY